MQYCSEKELNDQDIVQAYLGNPFKEPGKLLTVTGSGGYFIEDLTLSNTLSTDIPEDAKATIQRYENGIFVLFNKSNKQYGIMLAWNDIAFLELKEGKRIDQRLQPLHKSLFIESNPAPVKYAAKLLGLCGDEIRLPLVKIKSETENQIKKALSAAELI